MIIIKSHKLRELGGAHGALRCQGLGVWAGFKSSPEIVVIDPFMGDPSENQQHLSLKKPNKTGIKTNNKQLAPRG